MKRGIFALRMPDFFLPTKFIKGIDEMYRYRFIDDPELLRLNLVDQIKLLEEKDLHKWSG